VAEEQAGGFSAKALTDLQSPSASDLAEMGKRLSGEVLMPESPGYESWRRPANPRFHHIRPRAIALCATEGDVSEVLAVARSSKIPVVARSGGHCFVGRSSSEGIVLDLTPMHVVAVREGVATVGAGTRLGELYDRLDQHGVTLPAGCGPTVGISGLTLGGGLGVLGRRYGLTCDSLLAARVVLADSGIVECDEGHHPDLFWAIRGGGGNFGVVTSLVFQTVRASDATIFKLTWPYIEAGRVLGAWQEWAPDARDEVFAVLRISAPVILASRPG
jgi:FAD/FMN-containing dehydrogenase